MTGTGIKHLHPADEALLRVEDLIVAFPAGPRRTVHAVSGVSFDVMPGETVGLVGESGCGKSSLGRAIVQLPRPKGGSICFEGVDLMTLNPGRLRRVRSTLQLIYQDPISSLNPRRTIADIVEEPLRIWKDGDEQDRRRKVETILEAVGLDARSKSRRPHEFSGGQCQRVSIARALILQPKLMICDEPVSALDVSVQAQILNLLEDMKARYGLTMIFISHDLAVVKNISDRVLVMYLGKICELAPSESAYRQPAHPYTRALLAAVPSPQPNAARDYTPLPGELPSPLNPPSGCRFRTRCPLAQTICAQQEPQMRRLASDPARYVACHFPLLAAEAAP